MIGVYDYTVVLTYLSTCSGLLGIIFTMTEMGHPYCGTLFLMISGLLDGFDGKVARTKHNRTDLEKRFGIQIDSLSDLICFGVLPATIGIAQLRVNGRLPELSLRDKVVPNHLGLLVLLISIAVFYVLAALIRLAYFNSTTEERAEEAKIKGKEYFTGMPVTVAALVFPLTLVVHWFVKADLTMFYFWVLFIMSLLFVGNFKIPKPNMKQFVAVFFVGLIEFVAVIFILFFS